MDLSIIVINYNSRKYLRECLQSLYADTHGMDFEVLVIDNASFDGCGQMLSLEFPDVRFTQSVANLGFAKANNFLASLARGDVLLFLNPDTKIEGEAVSRLYRSMVSLDGAGAAGARILNGDGTLQTSCIQTFPTISAHLLDSDLLRRFLPWLGVWGTAPLLDVPLTPFPVDSISGACFMTPKKIFETLGGFSEEYFMYYEDTDYCRKAAAAGLKTYIVPDAVVVHYGGKSSEGTTSRFSAVMMAESGWKYFRTHRGRGYAALFRACLGFKALSRSFLLAACMLFTHSKKFSGSFKKWLHVFKWCLGAEGWVTAYPKTGFRS